MTRMGLAHAEPVLTSSTCESWFADTEVVVGQLDAVQTVCRTTGIGEALVNVTLTPLSGESRRAVAAIASHSINTGAIVQTLWRGISQPQWWGTVILIDLTKNT